MYALAIHGGAGARPSSPLSREREQAFASGLAQAISAGQAVLERDGSALDAVEAAVRVLEDDPHFNAGRGAVLTSDGTAELDAAIMDGEQLRAGAVAAVRTVRNPVQLARRVLEDTPHVFLVGEGAERFAAECGIEQVDNHYFLTPEREAQLRALRIRLDESRTRERQILAGLEEPPFGTVGAVARDRLGRLAAATSTGGMNGQRPGRVGDSPVIGAGTYADSQICAVSTTGHGEWFLRAVQAYDIAARMRYGGASLEQAVEQSIMQRLPRLGASGGLIAVDQAGKVVIRYNTPAMFRGHVRSGEAPQLAIC
ncbi:MAG TPA: isoaspartyl peptidase/L-asparaginase [Steroidobacteraceae bacterium]|jgi:beta-aspartyl-peptidase (threonine type)